VVVHEADQVEPFVTPQQEREEVRLPQLVRLRPLEPPLRLLPRGRLRLCLEQPLLVEDPPHHALRDAERLEPPEDIADAPRPELRVLFLQRLHGAPLRVGLQLPPLGRAVPRQETVNPGLPVASDPLEERRLRNPEYPRDNRRRCALLHDLASHPDPGL
jgi:hypothetical protein